MYTKDEYEKLLGKYGDCASWAIWDYHDENKLSVIEDSYQDLKSDYIFLALNISKPLTNGKWKNFHGGKHDRKLKYACNDTTLRGAYITDLFKNLPEVSSSQFENKLSRDLIDKNISFFRQEMQDIKIHHLTKFIVMGVPNSLIARCFDTYFKQFFNNETIYYYHYSYYRLTDSQWVTGLWNKLNIESSYSEVNKRYAH